MAINQKYKVQDVAELYAVDEHAVLAWIKSGVLRAVNVGKGKMLPRWRITEDALEEFERRRTSLPLPKLKKRNKRNIKVGPYPTS